MICHNLRYDLFVLQDMDFQPRRYIYYNIEYYFSFHSTLVVEYLFHNQIDFN